MTYLFYDEDTIRTMIRSASRFQLGRLQRLNSNFEIMWQVLESSSKVNVTNFVRMRTVSSTSIQV